MFLNRLSGTFKRYATVVWQLVVTDLMVFRSSIVGSVIDTGILTFLTVGTMTYIFPLLGMTQDYGPFVAWSAIPSAGIFEIFGFAMVLLSDIRGERSISSRLILPIPTYLVFVAKAYAYACRALINVVAAAGVGVVVLLVGGRFSAEYFSFWKFGVAVGCILLFVGFFTLFVVSLIKDVYRLNSVWKRVLSPMHYFGGAQFSWKTAVVFLPAFGYLSLLNPVLYLNEGIHAATLNPEQFLNFWLCCGVMLLMTVLFGVMGIKRLKKQLQWV
ncbi:TPA: hypothetical protein DDZ86_04190 [Candidatus Dependentiae bacterium]|nr:MAG: hypothetical protein UW09_C0003G0185 [candidate division TM6 bacterium GW2011_GWF2_43_87]HBL98814.1 hypothetical protein [Candidatus Dependentiae bacterium]